MKDILIQISQNIEITYILIIIFAALIHFMAEPLRWYFYLKNTSNLKYYLLFNIYSLTAMISYLLPMKMGLPARLYLLKTKAHITILQSSTLLLIDGIINYFCWGITSFTGLYILSKQDAISPDYITVFAASIIVLFFIILVWNKKHVIYSKFLNSSIKHSSNKYFINTDWKTIVFTTSIMLVDIMSHVVRHGAIFLLLGIDLEWQIIFLITTVSLFTGIISMMPMGLGGYDGMLILLLSQFSVPPEIAVSAAIINRFVSLALSLILGIYSGFQLNMNPFNRNWRKLLTIENKIK